MNTKEKILLGIRVIVTLFSLSSLILLLYNSPVSTKIIFDYSGFLRGSYDFETTGFLGWTYLMGVATLVLVVSTIYTVYYKGTHSKNRKEDITVINKKNNISPNLNNKIFPGSMPEEKDKNVEKIEIQDKAVLQSVGGIREEKVEEKPRETAVQINATENIPMEQNKQFNSDQMELLQNNNLTDGISDMMLDFAPVTMSGDGTEEMFFDDPSLTPYFEGETKKTAENEIPQTADENLLADKISERLGAQIAGFYDRTSSQMQDYFSTLSSLQKEILELRGELSRTSSAPVEDVQHEQQQREKTKQEKLAQLKELEREANKMKDLMLDEQKKETRESMGAFRYKGF